MSQPILQLSNSANWENVFYASKQAVIITPSPLRYYPIPELVIPVLLEHHILAVNVTSSSAKLNWHYAGMLVQRITLGLTVGGVPDADSASHRKAWLNETQLLIFPKLTSTYSLVFRTPYWIQDFTLTIWQYIGTESDSTEDLVRAVQQDLARVESKVDSLPH